MKVGEDNHAAACNIETVSQMLSLACSTLTMLIIFEDIARRVTCQEKLIVQPPAKSAKMNVVHTVLATVANYLNGTHLKISSRRKSGVYQMTIDLLVQ